MFVLATMAAVSTTGPVKIRNMSPGGALIEGEFLPRVGERVSLRRAGLAASGTIVWRGEGKAGVAFERQIEVTRWLPVGSTGQQRVDRIFQEFKASPAPPAAVPQVAPAPQVAPSPIDTAEVVQAAAALDVLADALAEDAAVVAAHGAKLQTLDLAAQLLRRFAASI